MKVEADRPYRGRVTQLAIVDDHDFARESLEDMLADHSDIRVVGQAANGQEGIDLCLRLQPDLLLMDVRMPEMDGLAATREIKRVCPGTSVLMVTVHENPNYLFEALKAGAAGYILKDASEQEIISAIRDVRDNECPLDPALAARLLRRLADESRRRESHRRDSGRKGYHFERLTARELEVLELLKLGMTNPQISRELMISVRTVKNHVEHIIAKLGVSDRTQAVVRALELGHIRLSD